MNRTATFRSLVLALLSVVALCRAQSSPLPYDEQTVREMNRAVGLMEQYRFTEAATAFGQVTKLAPNWAPAYVNLGIAYLNSLADASKAGGAFDKAQAAFERATRLDPKLPHPWYCLGLLHRYKGESDAALTHFQKVLDINPNDADSLYFVGAIHLSKGDAPKAIEYFLQSIARNPYLVSAHYSLAQALIRSQKRDEAMRVLETFKQLNDAKVGVKRAIVYTEMGNYADVIRVFPRPSDAGVTPSISIRFASAEVGLSLPHAGKKVAFSETGLNTADLLGAGFALGDVDADGDLDVYVPARQMPDKSVKDVLFENRGGKFVPKPLSVPSANALGGVFGDFDNDGDADLYVLRMGENALLRNDGNGTFADVTAAAKATGDSTATPSLSAAWVDADHDGDLDLLVASLGGLTLLRNNGNGTFLDITNTAGLTTPAKDLWGLAVADFDDDTDVDFVVTAKVARPQLFSNDRLNRWSDATLRTRFRQETGACVLAGDFDKDGDSDLILLRGETQKARFYVNRGDGAFDGYDLLFSGSFGAVLDYDNDCDLDLFVVQGRFGDGTQSHALVLANDGGGRFRDATAEVALNLRIPTARSVLAADLDNDGDTDVLVSRNGETPLYLRNDGGNRNHWLRVQLKGTTANRSGYGAQVEVKAGSLWQKIELQMVGGVASGANPRIELGLGQRTNADFVRVVWPNAVLQSEIEVAANQPMPLSEVQRKASSCPVLFAWNGERFEFVTDFMGGGGLGFYTGASTPGVPDPTERVKIEQGQIQPLNGEYMFQIMEPMEEVAYVDDLQLLAVDHPVGTEVTPNERFATDGNPPDGRLLAYAKRIYPVAAVDHEGRDVLSAFLKRDRAYQPLEKDTRFLGYLNGEHAVILDFGQLWSGAARRAVTDGDAPAGSWILNLYGWIEYPYSHIVYAAEQAGVVGEGIHVDVMREDGSWETKRANVGYPAGMPKMMTLELPIPSRGDGSEKPLKIRLRTNLEIYYDEIFLAQDVAGETLKVTPLHPSRATLQHSGYPREFSPDGRMPRIYDYSSVDKTYAFRNMRGAYTRFGDVRELLDGVDDRYVVMGRGEEITVAFDANGLPPIPAGYTRSFVLDTYGWCKDMDLYTTYPDTVGPLPFRSMSGYPYAEGYPATDALRVYRDAYQTREK